MKAFARRWLFILVGLLIGGPLSAAVPTAITKVPYIITKPGRYVLSKSLVYPGTGFAITINTDNVVLDLGDWTLESLSPGEATQVSITNQTAGIFAQDRKNITIRNGTIRGFFRGIYLEGLGGRGHLVENVRADACTFLGIQVKGIGSSVRRNRVSKIGGNTAYTLERIGIDIQGDSFVVADNEVIDVAVNSSNGTDRAYGIRVLNNNSASISGNRIFNSQGLLPLANTTSGIQLGNCNWGLVAGNQVSGYALGVEVANGSNNLYRDNTVTRAFGAYSVAGGGGTAGPGNSP